MNYWLEELVQAIGRPAVLAAGGLVGLIIGWFVGKPIGRVLVEVLGLDVSVAFEADEDGR